MTFRPFRCHGGGSKFLSVIPTPRWWIKIPISFLLLCFILGLSVNILNAEEKSHSWKSSPVWSPRENKICFILTEQNIAWKKRREKLCLIDADGTNLKELPGTLGIVYDNFCWSPSGKGIAFVKQEYSSTLLSESDIYVTNKDGSVLRKLTSSKGNYSQLSWSPDRKKIAFKKSSSGSGEIWLIDSSGASRKLTDGTYPSWSPNGKQIAFIFEKMEGISSMGQTLGVINVDDGTQYHFTPKDKWLLKELSGICWSPSGDKLFFISRGHIYSIKTQNSQNRDIAVHSEMTKNYSDLSMSRDGKKLYFSGLHGVCVMDLSLRLPYNDYGLVFKSNNTEAKISPRAIKNISGNKLDSPPSLSPDDRDPSLSPDSKQIVFTRDGELWLMNSDGSHQAQLTNGQGKRKSDSHQIGEEKRKRKGGKRKGEEKR